MSRVSPSRFRPTCKHRNGSNSLKMLFPLRRREGARILPASRAPQRLLLRLLAVNAPHVCKRYCTSPEYITIFFIAPTPGGSYPIERRRNIAIWLGTARRSAADNKAEFRRIHPAGYERARVYLTDRFLPSFISVAVINSAECCYFRTPRRPKTMADCCARKYTFAPEIWATVQSPSGIHYHVFPLGNRIGA